MAKRYLSSRALINHRIDNRLIGDAGDRNNADLINILKCRIAGTLARSIIYTNIVVVARIPPSTAFSIFTLSPSSAQGMVKRMFETSSLPGNGDEFGLIVDQVAKVVGGGCHPGSRIG